MLYFMTVYLIASTIDERNARSYRLLFCLSTGFLFLITICFTVQGMFGQHVWIIDRDYPGGPSAYIQEHISVWYRTLGIAASAMLNLMSDGFLVRPNIHPIALPPLTILFTAISLLRRLERLETCRHSVHYLRRHVR